MRMSHTDEMSFLSKPTEILLHITDEQGVADGSRVQRGRYAGARRSPKGVT